MDFATLADLFKNGNVILAPVVLYLFWMNAKLFTKLLVIIETNTGAMQKTADAIEKCRKG